MSKAAIIGELWRFMRERKKWLLLPMILVIVLLSALMVFAQTSPIAPFLYTFI
jgi:competence protein ComGC